MHKSFVTNIPDKAGAFLLASRIIAEHNGNIVRVSYNKAVDLHTLFLEIDAPEDKLNHIKENLLEIGYINDRITETRVIEVLAKIPHRPGALLPMLEIINKHDINISYLNYISGENDYQDFKLGLLIEDPTVIKILLDEISEIYQINVIECENNEENLDNTVFYIRLANEMQQLLGLSPNKTMQFITESNRILQVLHAEGEDASKIFDYIRRFAHFVSNARGDNFKVNIEKIRLTETILLYSIQPDCGSNTYVFDMPNEIVIIDTGYAIFADEMFRVFRSLIERFDEKRKRVYITHSDVDHCGLLSRFDDAEIIINQKSMDSFKKQKEGRRDHRENNELRSGYSKISRIISGYTPPDIERLKVLDTDTPISHADLIKIGNMPVGELDFTIYEGSGGHLNGEMVYVCENCSLVFTGDLLVNISGFAAETAKFNALAPFLIKSVNTDSHKATAMRRQITKLVAEIAKKNKRPCIICGGHGPLSELIDGKLISIEA